MALLPVAEALQRMLGNAKSTANERVALRHAAGRTLAEPVVALLDNPPFDASAMDGYAVRAADVTSTTTPLQLVGVSAAGKPYSGAMQRGQTVRIFTGAKVPEDADTVILQEDARDYGHSIMFGEVPSQGQNVRKRAEDFANGQVLIERGRRLKSRDILLAASGGHATLTVARKPVVAILSTGDELVEPGHRLATGQIPASNGYALAALIEGAGGEARLLDPARDTFDALRALIDTTSDADVLLTVGGASVGEHDLVRPALEQSGATLDFYKVAMRPGKPLFFGARQIGGHAQHCLGLPGNPVSALICARVFLVPFLARMLGRDAALEPFDAFASTVIPRNGPRMHYMRGSLDTSTVPPRAAPFGSQDSGRVSLLQRAECLIVVEPDMPEQPAGTMIKVLPFDF